ncbi:hypothetical protein L596_006211 [Steinernema carpocapsae]|uniref:Uncharacterized protein n=1 Tax=Steinernema carpocapsae TaxID=34508 RepID=A0A4U8V326_STECR|nr:hypothetical protein L596_006211 [Steinernema carpocapsae]
MDKSEGNRAVGKQLKTIGAAVRKESDKKRFTEERSPLNPKSTTVAREDSEDSDAEGNFTIIVTDPNRDTESDGSGTGEEEKVNYKKENADWNPGGFKTKPTEDPEDYENDNKRRLQQMPQMMNL